MGNQQSNIRIIRRLRVLIVENRPTTRQVHVDNVTRWGYEPVVAEGTGDALIQNALELARTRCCQLALVDKRLRDDYNGLDTSGIDLIEKIQPTSTILITGYPDHESTLAAMQKGAVTVVAKKDGPEAVRAALQKAAEKDWHPTVQIVWPSGWSAKRVTNLLAKDKECADSTCEDEANHITARLFPQARRVVLERLNKAAKSPKSARISAVRLNSLLFFAYEDHKTPVVIKLLPCRKAIQEQENYDNFIDGHLEGNRYANMVARQDLWDLGGHVYKLIGFTGTEILTFDDLYTQSAHDPDTQLVQDQKLIDILGNFFGTIWQRNNGQTKLSEESLFQLYDRNWNGKLMRRLDGWRERSVKIRKSQFLSVSIPDPLRWLAENFDASNLPNVSEAIVHGDLHGENLLLDEKYFAWVIDYEDTGYGHILRDYVELTQNILTRLHPGQDELTWLYELAISLARPRTPNERMRLTQAISSDRQSLRAFRIVDAIREFAYQFTRYGESREFLWSVLLDIAKLEPTLSKRDKRRRKLLYLAGIFCYRLEHWGDGKWPPENWPQVNWLDDQIALSVADLPDGDNPGIINILFLAANPSDTTSLQIDREYRGIKEAIKKAGKRERFALTNELAVRVNELIHLLVQLKPTIVHFSGHGSKDGEIILEDEGGNSFPLPQEAVKRIFGILNRDKNQVRCVILNACFTEQQAKYIAEYVDIVVGIASEISDTSATKFASAFYAYIGEGQNVQTAFDLACANIDLHGLGFQDALRLITKQEIDPNHYRMV